jgi:hypothetical protein
MTPMEHVRREVDGRRGGTVDDETKQCRPINEELEIHVWPFPDPPVGTACKCGQSTRKPPRWDQP